MAALTKEQWKKRKRRKKRIIKVTIALIFLLPFLFIINTLHNHFRRFVPANLANITSPSGIEVNEMFLTPNPYSRPQTSLDGVNNIVVHYTGNPGTTAISNRNYFENLKSKHTTYASSHFVVGLEGEIIQCLPLNEMSYASNHRNNDTISIETCHPDESGKFNDITYEALVKLVANLLHQYNLTEKDVIRHYDVTGKLCPLYFVEHEDSWEEFKNDVGDYLTSIK